LSTIKLEKFEPFDLKAQEHNRDEFLQQYTHKSIQKLNLLKSLMKFAAETCAGRELHARRRKEPAPEVTAQNRGRGEKI
jgi:hypothetical protein